jgi:hypothetical protein
MEQEQTLKTASEAYWDETIGEEPLVEQMYRYVCKARPGLEGRGLLQAELDWAKEHDQIQVHSCETLVLLVGFSPEPLLQSVCVYQPKKVILVLNQWYGEEEGIVFAQHFQEGIEYLEQKHLIDPLPEFINDPGYVLPQDDPASVFQTLVGALHDVSDAVIDITGGKKSMVAGAFLYAAYAGIPISYVDFDEYHPEKRRPYGHSCRIGEITSPYRQFALREWEQVRASYTDYKFREAQKTLEKMWPQVKGYFPDDADGYVQTMLDVFRCYEAWDAGDYNEAHAKAQKIPSFTPPDAVITWNGKWVTISGDEFNSVPRFYEDSDRFRAYVCDELARIRRLIDCSEDYLSAFLRSGGLNEIVMVARLVRLAGNPSDRNALLAALDQEATPTASSVFKALLNLGKDKKPKRQPEINIKKDLHFPGGRNIPQFTIKNSTPMSLWWTNTATMFNAKDGWQTFLDERNDLTHQYYSPPPKWAEDALAFVKANFEDFLGHPVDDLNINTEAIKWAELCRLSGMNRYLPSNLRKEAGR